MELLVILYWNPWQLIQGFLNVSQFLSKLGSPFYRITPFSQNNRNAINFRSFFKKNYKRIDNCLGTKMEIENIQLFRNNQLANLLLCTPPLNLFDVSEVATTSVISVLVILKITRVYSYNHGNTNGMSVLIWWISVWCAMWYKLYSCFQDLFFFTGSAWLDLVKYLICTSLPNTSFVIIFRCLWIFWLNLILFTDHARANDKLNSLRPQMVTKLVLQHWSTYLVITH